MNNPFRPGQALGENMYREGPSSRSTGANAVRGWISEKQWYHYAQDDGMAPLGLQDVLRKNQMEFVATLLK